MFSLTRVRPQLLVPVGGRRLTICVANLCPIRGLAISWGLPQSWVNICRMPLLMVGIGRLKSTDVTVFVAHLLTLGRVSRVPQLVGSRLLHRV